MKPIRRRTLASALAAALCSPLTTAAQTAAALPAYEQPGLHCYRGRPAPACQTFVITEIGFYRRLVTTTLLESRFAGDTVPNAANAFSDRAAIELGIMRNWRASSAIGATLLLGADATGARFGAKARYRRWLTADGLSVDLAAGVIIGNLPRVSRTASLSGDVAINFSDFGALVVGGEFARPNGHSRAALFGGARLGSKPGLITTGLATIGALVVAVALASWRWE